MNNQENRRSDPVNPVNERVSSQGTENGIAGLVELFWNHNWLFSLMLVVVTLLVYLPALAGQFIWDDDSWTTNISGLLSGFSGLQQIWCNPTALQQYYPLTGTTFWLDHQLWGFWTLPYHLENVLLHALSALLFWQLLRRLQMPGAWLAGAIFALHPVMVESAAWITERKNVLSLVFYLGALLAYGRFNDFWKLENNSTTNTSLRRWDAYVLALVLFLAALLSKTTTFSLPAVILLICWWKRRGIRWRADVLPTLPFFAVSIGLCLVTAWLEKNHVGARGPEWMISFPERCLIAGRALWFYTGKLLWPANLCFVYPQWRLDAGSWWQWLYPVSAIGVVLVFWLARGRMGRGPAAAAFYFVGTLFPVLGFLNAYFMRFSFVCDHWVYLSSLGLIALAAALVVRAAEYFRAKTVFYGFGAAVLPVLALLTWRQCGMYTDIETLWRTTLIRNPDAYLAHSNLAYVLLHSGRVDEAIDHYRKAIIVLPHDAKARSDMGNALLWKGLVDEAIVHFHEALKIRPNDVYAQNSLGFALFQKGQVDEAIAHFQKALEIQPNDAYAHDNLANALLRKGQIRDAITHYQRSLELEPNNTRTLSKLARVLATSPDASVRNGPKAIELAQAADRLSSGANPAILRTLAASYAEAGKFPEAIATAQRALQLAGARTNTVLMNTLKVQIASYQAGFPSRDTELTNTPTLPNLP